jgi:uncharacterized membrane protein required for colicin V production
VNLLDIVYSVIIGLTAFNGLRKGLITSAFEILALITATFLTWQGGGPVLTKYLVDNFSLPHALAQPTAWVIVWTIVYFLIYLLGKELSFTVSHSLVAPFNSSLGTVFGGLKGYLYTLIISFLLANSIISWPVLQEIAHDSLLVNASLPILKTISRTSLKSIDRKIASTFQIKRYFSTPKKLKLIEENLDVKNPTDIANATVLYKQINKKLDF